MTPNRLNLNVYQGETFEYGLLIEGEDITIDSYIRRSHDTAVVAKFVVTTQETDDGTIYVLTLPSEVTLGLQLDEQTTAYVYDVRVKSGDKTHYVQEGTLYVTKAVTRDDG